MSVVHDPRRCTELLTKANHALESVVAENGCIRRDYGHMLDNLTSTQARCTELLLEGRQLKARVAELESNALEIAQVAGVVYEADFRRSEPGPHADVLASIREVRARVRQLEDAIEPHKADRTMERARIECAVLEDRDAIVAWLRDRTREGWRISYDYVAAAIENGEHLKGGA